MAKSQKIPKIPEPRKTVGKLDKVLHFFGKKKELDEEQEIDFPEPKNQSIHLSDESEQLSPLPNKK
mgnify:CR=1 FL=1